jgi:hypothetical protein
MGYARLTPKVGVKVCRECPSRAEAQRECKEHGFDVILSICPEHFQRQQETILGERQISA